MWSLLTLTPDRRYALLHEAWNRRENYDHAGQLFLALCLAEQGPTHPRAIDLIYTASPSPVLDGWRRALQQQPDWRLEERPELAVAALSLVLGEATVTGWMTDRGKEIFQKVLHDVFTNKEGKFVFAVRKARALVDG